MARRYFSRAIAGTEDIVWQDINRQLRAELVTLEWRRIEFSFDGDPQRLLALRSVDDIYILVGKLVNIGKHRHSLDGITEQISGLSFSDAVDACRQIRTMPDRPNYSITATLLGNRNYSRYEVAKAVQDGLAAQYSWNHIERAENNVLPDIDVRVLLEYGDGIVGVRLNAYPLHRREYKILNLPGSLRPPLAYIMCLLSEVKPNHIVLDPMCGVGTIPIEASQGFPARMVMGLDINKDAITYSLANSNRARCRAYFQVGDVTQLPYANNSIDRIITNMPWGRQVNGSIRLSDLYPTALGEFARVINVEGLVVLLTDRTDFVLKSLETHLALRQIAAKQISLFGSHPKIHILAKDR